MSSGITTKTYGVTLDDQQHVEISNSREYSIQRRKFQLLSEFISELFIHKNSEETMKNVSNLIVLSLNTFKNNPQNELITKIENNFIFTGNSENTQKSNNPFKKYGRILNYIHSVVANYPELTSNEKLDYCNIERAFIKLVFKELALKL